MLTNTKICLVTAGADDLFMLKPAEVRCWTRTIGLNDADIILADHWIRRADATSRA